MRAGPRNYAFNVGAGAPFDVTVNEVNADAGCPGYTLTVSGFGIVRGAPTAASFLGLAAKRAQSAVSVRWRTGAETKTLGYHVYREQAGKRVRVSDKLIPAAGRPGLHVYNWLDRKAPRGAARYWVQGVGLDGKRTWHGPASVS